MFNGITETSRFSIDVLNQTVKGLVQEPAVAITQIEQFTDESLENASRILSKLIAGNPILNFNPQNLLSQPEALAIAGLAVTALAYAKFGPAGAGAVALILLAAGCTGKAEDSGITGDTSSVGCEDSAFDQIDEAIDYASEGATIEVCDGTYDPFSVYDASSLTIKAREGHFPQIDASGARSGISVFSEEWGFKFVLDGFEVFGATENGIRIYFEDGGVELSNLDVHDNGTDGSTDAGIHIGDYSSSSSIFISDSILHDNTGDGLDIYMSNSGDVDLNNLELYGHTDSGIELFGGGVSDPTVTMTANDLNVHDNGSASIEGGGLYLYSVAGVIDQSTITDNTAYWGGGILVSVNSSLTLIDSDIQDNVATDATGGGGGLQLYAGTVTAYNTNWGGTNEPYDVSAQDRYDDDSTPTYVYDYGTNESFQCEYDVGCWDL